MNDLWLEISTDGSLPEPISCFMQFPIVIRKTRGLCTVR